MFHFNLVHNILCQADLGFSTAQLTQFILCRILSCTATHAQPFRPTVRRLPGRRDGTAHGSQAAAPRRAARLALPPRAPLSAPHVCVAGGGGGRGCVLRGVEPSAVHGAASRWPGVRMYGLALQRERGRGEYNDRFFSSTHRCDQYKVTSRGEIINDSQNIRVKFHPYNLS